MARAYQAKFNPMKTKWDKFVFIVTYFIAGFFTICGAEACNTTTIWAPETVTEFVTLSISLPTVTVTQFSSGFNGTSTILPGPPTGTSAVTELTTTTVGGEIRSQSSSFMRSDSTSTLTVTTLATSFLNHTLTSTLASETFRGNGTRVSIPQSLTLTFPIVTASSLTPPFPMSNITSTYTVTSTAHVGTAASETTTTNPRPSWGAPQTFPLGTETITSEPFSPNVSIETSFPISIPDVSSVFSEPSTVVASITAEVNTASTTTVTTLTTITATGRAAVVSTITVLPVESVLSDAASLLGSVSSQIATSTGTSAATHTVTNTPIESVLSAATSHLSIATSELATVSSDASTSTVTVLTTVSVTVPNIAPAGTGFAVNVTLSSTETQSETMTSVLTLTSILPKFLNATSTVTLFSTVPVFTSLNISASTVSALAPSAVNATSIATVLNNKTTAIIVPTVVTASVPGIPTAPGLPVFSTQNSSTTSTSTISHKPTVTLSSTNTTTVFSATSVSTAMPLFNSTLTGGTSSLRVPRVFSFLSTVLNLMSKKTLVGAVDAGESPFFPVLHSSSSEVPDLTTTPLPSVPAHPAPVSISTSTESCTSNFTANMTATATAQQVSNTTITLATTVSTYSTVFSTLTTSIPGAVAPVNSSVNATNNSIAASVPLRVSSTDFPSPATENTTLTASPPVFGQNFTAHPLTTATSTSHAHSMVNGTIASTVTRTLSTASPTSGVGRVEITGALLVLLGVVAWIVL